MRKKCAHPPPARAIGRGGVTAALRRARETFSRQLSNNSSYDFILFPNVLFRKYQNEVLKKVLEPR